MEKKYIHRFILSAYKTRKSQCSKTALENHIDILSYYMIAVYMVGEKLGAGSQIESSSSAMHMAYESYTPEPKNKIILKDMAVAGAHLLHRSQSSSSALLD